MDVVQTPFSTKKFDIFHHNSTMKVGTDAILLGLWCNARCNDIVLDVGTGCGIIAMIIASRTSAKVVGIDDDLKSIKEAEHNFTESEIGTNLAAINTDFSSYSNQSPEKYDLIVSNPPFFATGLKSPNISRQKARHINNLTPHNLCDGASKLLSPKGRLCVVIPASQKNTFGETAAESNLFLTKELLISPTPNTPPNRVNMEFSFTKNKNVLSETFIIRNEDRSYSQQYKELTTNLLWI